MRQQRWGGVLLLLGLLVPGLGQAQTVSVNGGLDVDGTMTLSGTLTPAALAGNVDNYNPTGLATASTLRLDGGAADRTMTGIQGGSDGRLLTIINIGATNKLILATDTTSTAAYRFLFPASVTLVPKQSITLRYDGTTQRWRDVAGAGSIVEHNLYLTDVTTGNSTTGTHGLLPKLSGNAAQVFKGDGTWGTDATGTAVPGGSDGQVQYRVDVSTFGGSPGLALDADGIIEERRKCVTVTTDPAPMTARCYFVDTSGGNVTLTLPNGAMTNGAANIFDIYKVTNDANQLILNADTGDLINFVDQDLTTTDRGAGFHIEEQSGATAGNWIAQRAVTSVTAAMLTFSATDRLLGRDTAGAGAGEELTAAAVKTLLAMACADLTDEGGGCSMSTTAGGDLSGTLPSPTVVSASTTQAGKVELATAAETTTGTDATRAVTPDGLAGSVFGTKYLTIECVERATALTTGDGKCYYPIHPDLNTWQVVTVSAYVGAAVSSSGAVNVDMDICGAVATGVSCSGANRDVLSTNITIDANEDGTETAATAAVIDTANDDLATGEWLRINIDGAGTGTQGLSVTVGFRKP